jgi:hypothetical protein
MNLKGTVHVRQYRPSFFEGFKAEECDIETAHDLMQIEWIAKWAEDPGFYRFSISHPYKAYLEHFLLMAEFEAGAIWWVVAYIKGDPTHPFFETFPRWKHPE